MATPTTIGALVPMPLSGGVWKKALATFISAVSGYLLGTVIDPVIQPWTLPWLKHTLIVAACIGAVAELRFLQAWANYILDKGDKNGKNGDELK